MTCCAVCLRYWYWFAFPALVHPGLTIEITHAPHPIASHLPPASTAQLLAAVNALSPPPPFFVVTAADDDGIRLHALSALPRLLSPPASSASFPPPSLMLGFVDPSPLPEHPGWPARNLLLFAALCGMTDIGLICYRDLATSEGGAPASLVMHLTLAYSAPLSHTAPKVVGYEKNAHGKLAPRMISLSSLMSPLHLASSSVNLNLRLMRWRALPSLDLPLLASTRVLLLGAGTLGCSVARLLLAWGFSRITFVDSGVVSYSNPVRQSLFRHEDCVGGAKAKAQCAAERLKDVYPGVDSAGVRLSIPMVGHWSEREDEEMRRGLREVERLVDASDVVFQLTDSRESRWLPTLLCAAKHRLCINAALGFDSFVVMRHGDNFHVSSDARPHRLIARLFSSVTDPGLPPCACAHSVRRVCERLPVPRSARLLLLQRRRGAHRLEPRPHPRSAVYGHSSRARLPRLRVCGGAARQPASPPA